MTAWRGQSAKDLGINDQLNGTAQDFDVLSRQLEQLPNPQFYTWYGRKNRGLLGYFFHLCFAVAIISAIAVLALLTSRDSMRLETFGATFVTLTAIAAAILIQMFFRGRLQLISWVLLIAAATGAIVLIF